MSLTYSETEAALLQAARLCRQLTSRYRHALAHLVEGKPMRALLQQRADELQAHGDALQAWIRSRDLLPRDPHTELSDLQTLADDVTGWLDDDQASALSQRLADEERELLNELASMRQDDSLAEPVQPMLEAANRTISRLAHGTTT
ncbi:MAG: hypothetical protein KKC01_07705 [Gammaproteobacteria bacterium]|nr:hypothetical protein [Gammaproteobacteria bacterium]